MPTVEQIKDRKKSSLAVDIVVFTYISENDLENWDGWELESDNRGHAPVQRGWHVLVIGRKNLPYSHTEGYVCLPGGFVDYDEDPCDAAYRELKEETGLTSTVGAMFLVGVYGKKGRDPRSHVVSVAYGCEIAPDMARKAAGDDDAKWTSWVPVSGILTKSIKVGFDHEDIISDAMSKLDLNRY